MDIRTKLIASGQIRPAGTTTERGVRQTLIEMGHVVPCPNEHKSFDYDRLAERVNMVAVMRDFMTKVCGR